MKVRDLMTEKVTALRLRDDLSAVRNVLDELGVRHVPVVDEEGNLLGLVSQRDLLRHAALDNTDLPLSMQQEEMQQTRVGDIMTEDPEHVEPDEDIRKAAELMLDNKIGCLPVTEGSRLVGILTESDFVRAVLR